MAYLDEARLKEVGFKEVGVDVRVSEKVSIYNAGTICLGDHTRIDDFCILSAGEGGITIGNYVHIACYSSLIGQGPIVLADFSGLSSRVAIYSSNDDYSGDFLCHPTIPLEYRNVETGKVVLHKHAIIGTGSVILPNVEIGTGVVVGALSLVKEDCESFGVYAGCPARKRRSRSRKLLELETAFLDSQSGKT